MSRILLIDGNSILNRAFYGIKNLSTRDGKHTNAVYWFMNIFLRQIQNEQPDYVAVAFDLPGGTFRNRLYADYKGTRKGMPDDLAEQLPYTKDLLAYLGYAVVTCPDYEADDILGTLSRKASEEGVECRILTGDRDSLQLVDGNTAVLYPSTSMGRTETTLMDEAAVVARFGVTPSEIIDLKALMGDSSDNIPGVQGVGEKTATMLISSFHTIEGVYENIDDPSIKRAVREHLINGRDSAYTARTLVTIDRHAPIDEDLEKYRKKPGDPAAAAVLLRELQMHSLVEKLGLSDIDTAAASMPEQEEAETAQAVQTGDIEKLLKADRVSVTLSDSGIWFVMADGEFMPLDDAGLERLFSSDTDIYTDEAKKLYHRALELGFTERLIEFDCRIAGYLLDPSAGSYDCVDLAGEYKVSPSYATEPARLGFIMPLADTLKKRLEETGMTSLMNEIEMPLCRVLASMEREGFLVDRDGIAEFGDYVSSMAESEQQEVFREAGHEFNLNSPKQLGDVLFTEMGLPSGKKTKTGYSTDAKTLEKLAYAYPIVEHILQYRSYQKLRATYVDGLTEAADLTGRIHTEFRQTETRTGRISSVNPNLQNIPIRTELGANMRKFFVAGDGNVLLDADYSQIELRVLASMSGDRRMAQSFIDGHDVHTETACEIFGLPRDMITSEMRRRAKAINFGIVYGMGAYTLSQNIKVPVKEAQQYIDDYFRSYPDINRFLNDTVLQARRDGYVTTMYGRRRYITELSSSNRQVQALGTRLAMNTPIQGTAADIIKIAMVRTFERLKKEVPEAKLILQVHDELIIECPEELADRASEVLQETMESACKLSVPLVAEVHRGKNWYDAK